MTTADSEAVQRLKAVQRGAALLEVYGVEWCFDATGQFRRDLGVVLASITTPSPQLPAEPVQDRGLVDPVRAIVIRYIDRMNDVAPECGDSAERILCEFSKEVNDMLLNARALSATEPAIRGDEA